MSDWHETFQLLLATLIRWVFINVYSFFLFFPVCRDFAVLEDHCLAHNLQEQESKGPSVLFWWKSAHFHSAFFSVSLVLANRDKACLRCSIYFFFWWCLAAFHRRLALCLLCQRINTKGWLKGKKKNAVPFPFPLFCEICKVLCQELQPGTACRNPVSGTAWYCQRCRMLEQYCIRLRRLRRIVHRINLWSQPWWRGALITDHKSASQKL